MIKEKNNHHKETFLFVATLVYLDTIMVILIIMILGSLDYFNITNIGIDIGDFWISFVITFFKIITGYYLYLYAYIWISKGTLNNFSLLKLLSVLLISFFLSTIIMIMMGKSDDWLTTFINAFKLSPPFITHIVLISSITSLLLIYIFANEKPSK